MITIKINPIKIKICILLIMIAVIPVSSLYIVIIALLGALMVLLKRNPRLILKPALFIMGFTAMAIIMQSLRVDSFVPLRVGIAWLPSMLLPTAALVLKTMLSLLLSVAAVNLLLQDMGSRTLPAGGNAVNLLWNTAAGIKAAVNTAGDLKTIRMLMRQNINTLATLKIWPPVIRGGWRFYGENLALLAVVILLGTGIHSVPPSSAGGTAPGTAGTVTRVELTAPDIRETLDLKSDRILPVTGAQGSAVLAISRGTIRFQESSCRNKICMHQGHLGQDRTGILYCAPNRIMLRAIGEDYDALAR